MTELDAPPLVDISTLSDGRRVQVVRDDLIPGGTKRRVLPPLLEGCSEAVYASPAEGFAQVALAYAAAEMGIRASVFVAARKERHPNTVQALLAGADLYEERPGYLNVIKARAREYCERNGARLLPFGLEDPRVVNGIASVARATLLEEPAEVWCVAGSGVLARGLGLAWPNAKLRCVQIGRALRLGDLPGGAELMVAPEPFAAPARVPPPFPSCSNYDAKAWRFISEDASDGAVFWNVAA